MWHRVRSAIGAIQLVLLAVMASAAHAQSDNQWLNLPPREAPAARQGAASGAGAQTAQRASAARISREVLGLYDSSQEPAPDRTRIHRLLEMPLNHLGLKVTYWDVRKGFPDAEAMKRYRGVVTWFSDRLENPAAYLDWAARTAQAGTRFAVFDFVGSKLGPQELPAVNGFLRNIGVEIVSRWVGPSEAGRIVVRDDAMIGFETKPVNGDAGYMVIEPSGKGTKSHLVLESLPLKAAAQVRSAVVVTGPGGGYAEVGFTRRYDKATQRLSWVLNPFQFLTAALAIEQAPIPDTTTVSGRRIYFSHIDGDAWNSLSTVASGKDAAAEVVLRELIAPNPDMPVTVGLIGSDVSESLGGGEDAKDIARRIFALPQVEVASHTHSHPFKWGVLETYSRESEIARVTARRATVQRSYLARPEIVHRLASRPLAHNSLRSFMAYGDGMPRAWMHRAFDLKTEVAGALDISRRLAPEGKAPLVYLWSGDTQPFEAAVKATRDAGVRNLNGGDSRLDADFPSVIYVPPISRPVGAERQIYAVNSNENTYTNDWSGPFDGQAKLLQTWANTDKPRRLKGLNLYYHMYSGERPESLGAVKMLIEQARAQKIAPITASQYAAIADSFFDVETAKVAPMKWRVANRGALQTVRFDEAQALWVDMKQSFGVLGFTHHDKALYVTLDEAVPEATIALTASRPDPRRQERPYLVDSRWQVSRLKVLSCGLEADVKGFGAGEMTWAGVRPGSYTASLSGDPSGVDMMAEVAVDASGELRLAMAPRAINGARLKVACGRTLPVRTGTINR